MEITGREIGWSVTSFPYHCHQPPALLAVWVPVISVAMDPIRGTWLTSDLKQTPTWIKQSRPGYRHLTQISFLPGYKPWYSFTLSFISALFGVGGWSTPPLRPQYLRERAPQTMLLEAGWDPGPVGTGLVPTDLQSPNLPAWGGPLYRIYWLGLGYWMMRSGNSRINWRLYRFLDQIRLFCFKMEDRAVTKMFRASWYKNFMMSTFLVLLKDAVRLTCKYKSDTSL